MNCWSNSKKHMDQTFWVSTHSRNKQIHFSSYFVNCLGAKRSGSYVTYLVRLKEEQGTHEIQSPEAKKDPIPYIDFLQSKIVYEDEQNDVERPSQTILVGNQNAVNKVECKCNPFVKLQNVQVAKLNQQLSSCCPVKIEKQH